MRLLQTLITVLLIYNISFSQQWIRTFDGNSHGDDQIYSTVADNQGNIYVTGFTTRIGSGEDFCTIKYNSSGIIQWVSYYDGPAHRDDKAYTAALSKNGQFLYVTGYSKTTSSNSDITTIKYRTSDGTQAAMNRFGDPSNSEDRAFGITVDNFDYVYVTGFVTREGFSSDLYTVKYNSELVTVWQSIYNGGGNSDDRSFGIVTDGSGSNIYITGYITGSDNYTDMITINYDFRGNVKWLKTYNGTKNEDDKSFGLVIDNSPGGGVIITGYSTNENSAQDYTTIKYNSVNGLVKWVSKYNGDGEGTDNSFGIVVDEAGNSYLTGASKGSSGLYDFLTIKYSSSGTMLWNARYDGNGNGNDSAAVLVLSSSQNYLFVSGSSFSGTPSGKDEIVTIKYDVTSGKQIALSRIGLETSENDVCANITADTSDNVFVVGYTKSHGNGRDFITIKYLDGELIGLENISSEVPEGFNLFQNYPNPFNPATKIRFSLPGTPKGGIHDVKLVIYDVIGREVAIIVNEQLSSGTYEVDWDAYNVSGGVYFYTLSSADFRQTKRMVLVK